ncbi:MAG: DUF262 domain-containing protein [Paludibacteraceae bacterium]|nr:DUF262 domain-containing protein [Paludibacteraceae bacterium]
MNKYSFKSLFDTAIEIDDDKKITISKVEIPRIQRDYAQGRIEKKNENFVFNEKGRRFIECVFENLKSNAKMEMDFVYGAIKEIQIEQQKINILLPLDGQQRLTTLYLLYWYIGNRELDDKKELFNLLKKFSYETRTSSRRFCEEISSNLLTIGFEKETISEQIKDFSWFAKSYERDPTIQAMLNMIDKIHKLYGKEKLELYSNLDNLQFSILPLNHFNLTDELYIKMNARGKQLTDFENFKADLISWMKDTTTDKDFFNPQDKSKFVDYNGRKMPYYLAFSNKIDNELTNFLWNITKTYNESSKNKKGELKYPMGKLVDPLMLSLFYRWFLFEYIFNSKSTNKDIDKEEDFKFFEKEDSFIELKPFISLLNKECIQNFEKVLDSFCKNANTIFKKSKASWQIIYNDARFLMEIGITQPQRVVLYGVFAYLNKNDFDADKFAQWMRVVWNIVENTDIDSWRSAIGVLELIKELADYSDDIYKKFPTSTNSSSSTNAVEEERKKINFIKSDPNWESAFIEAEKHLFFRGSVGFLITDGMSISDFEQRTKIANILFEEKGISENYRKEHILLRALISQYKDFKQIKDRCFTDVDEKEHYLKKMLASDTTVRDALSGWCSLNDEKALESALIMATATNSTMKNSSNLFETKMHEELYKDAALQNWMQANGAIKFAYYWQDCYYVYRPKSWYDWIMVDSYRDEIINDLVKTYSCEQSNQVGNSKYHWGGMLFIKRKIIKGTNEYDFIYEFSPNGDLRVGLKDTAELKTKITSATFASEDIADGWICRKKYNYKNVTKVGDIVFFIGTIEKDVFDLTNSNSLCYKLP